MCVGVSLTTSKRLGKLEQSLAVGRARAMWPALLPLDEWEAQAVVCQEALVMATREYIGPVATDTTPDPMDATHRYKPSASHPGTRLQAMR